MVKLYTSDAACIWLLTETDPDDTDVAFGLYSIDRRRPRAGVVRMPEIAAVRGAPGLPVERDLWFTADRPLSAYAADRCVRHYRVWRRA